MPLSLGPGEHFYTGRNAAIAVKIFSNSGDSTAGTPGSGLLAMQVILQSAPAQVAAHVRFDTSSETTIDDEPILPANPGGRLDHEFDLLVQVGRSRRWPHSRLSRVHARPSWSAHVRSLLRSSIIKRGAER
jgi:hypothetical protein